MLVMQKKGWNQIWHTINFTGREAILVMSLSFKLKNLYFADQPAQKLRSNITILYMYNLGFVVSHVEVHGNEMCFLIL